MTFEKFKKHLKGIYESSPSVASAWYEWAKDLEEMDSSYGELPPGTYKTAEVFLDEFVGHLTAITEKYGVEISRKVISLAEIPACPFPWEMYKAAKHLSDGGSVADIPDMETEGVLESFPDEIDGPDDSPTLQM